MKTAQRLKKYQRKGIQSASSRRRQHGPSKVRDGAVEGKPDAKKKIQHIDVGGRPSLRSGWQTHRNTFKQTVKRLSVMAGGGSSGEVVEVGVENRL
jgi:hypothetical protein